MATHPPTLFLPVRFLPPARRDEVMMDEFDGGALRSFPRPRG
jgi:hypothetical protein